PGPRPSSGRAGRPLRVRGARLSRAGVARLPDHRAARAFPRLGHRRAGRRSERRAAHVARSRREVRALVTLATDERLARLAAAPARFPGALLLTGVSDEALERESRRLAARLLCAGDDPGLECGACRRVASGLHPDFFPVEPEGVQIRVDRVREALVFAAGRPYEAPRRVIRIARAELLGLEAAHALLKSLEAP